MERIAQSVDAIELSIQNTDPPQLVITVTGSVRSFGWRNPRLSEHAYADFPQDGICAFDLLADEPAEFGPPAPASICTAHLWDGDLSRLKGIRVYAADNCMDCTLIPEVSDAEYPYPDGNLLPRTA